MIQFHISFFDFCVKNQPNTNLLTKPLLAIDFARAKVKPCVGLIYDNASVCTTSQILNNKSSMSHEPIFDAEYKPSFQSRSSMTGFKKALYNRAKLVRNQLYPSYNRRKYITSHYNIIKKQCTRLSRTYGYLSIKKINHFIAFASKYDPSKCHKRPCVKMIHYLESQLIMIMYRTLFTKSIMMARQELGSGKKHNKYYLGNDNVLKTQKQKHIFPGQLYLLS